MAGRDSGGASPGTGLTSSQVDHSRHAHGANVLPAPHRPSAVRRLSRQLLHFFALMLWVAAGLAWVAGIVQLAIAIVLVIVLNAAFAFVQEGRADRAAERLRTLLPRDVTVIRDGLATRIPSDAVVVGDHVVLTAGDRIPADGSVMTADSLRVDTSLLTGESRPRNVVPGDALVGGCFVTSGDGALRIDAVGAQTRLAAITHLATADTHRRTPLDLQLRRVVRLISVISVVVGLAFLLITLLLGNPLSEAAIFAIGVTVALVPEALLPTVTLTLALGAERMAERQVLIKELKAVETLGSTTFICSDKTGTLTRNEMSVVDSWVPGTDRATAVHLLAAAAVGCSDGYATPRPDGSHESHGDPMEVAIDLWARSLGIDTDAERQRTVLTRIPFDPHTRSMTVTRADGHLRKGAPDAVIPGVERIGDVGMPAAALAAVDDMAARGLRTLAVVRAPASTPVAEAAWQILGVLGLADPPREGVADALTTCRSAGVAVAMLTGDHPGTARAIADAIGLRGPDSPVVLGRDLPADSIALADLLETGGVVVARVSPEDKLRIAQALQARGHIVAMTGDGVNDVPALHAADIGVAMGRSGTDVAREAADLVLLDDHFASIVAGIEQGRTTFANIRRFLTYQLTVNTAEVTPFIVWAATNGSIPLALGVLQILSIDMATDTLSAVALGAEPSRPYVLQGPPVRGNLLNRAVLLRAFGLRGPLEAALSMTAFMTVLLWLGWPASGEAAIPAASGAAFLTVILAQAANAFACRSTLWPPWHIGWFTNRYLPPAVAIGTTIGLGTVAIPAIAVIFGQVVPPWPGWVVAILAPVVVLGVDTAVKARLRSTRNRPR